MPIRTVFRISILCLMCMSLTAVIAAAQPEPGLLFRLTADTGFIADHATGSPDPTFISNIEIIPDGVNGPAIRVPNFTEALAYDAPGNIHAARGTVAFHWRSREPLGPTPFHVFQVSYYDHSSIDMAWMRIDYNGEGGFDAFVTDRNLARVRVSQTSDTPPAAEDWTHIAFTWDETIGIRLYLNGRLQASEDAAGVWDAGLDQFGAHNRFINAQHIWSNYNHTRGGDFDDLVIYDRMLDADQVALLASGERPRVTSGSPIPPSNPVYRAAWNARFGWDDPENPPPSLVAPATRIKKVEVHDAYDLKQWVWKGCDGIRETSWPYVYNQSRLPGRLDYFIEPDWNCYSGSGKTVTFSMPDEPWNYLEIAGSAHGNITRIFHDSEDSAQHEVSLGDRPKAHERTFHQLETPVSGGTVRFTNTDQEEPIGEFSVFMIEPGPAPGGTARLTYVVDPDAAADLPCLDELNGFITGRFAPEEQTIVPALPGGAPRNPAVSVGAQNAPIVHVLVPVDFRIKRPEWTANAYSYTWEFMHDGLDGIEIAIPALDLPATHEDGIALNIRIADPLWPARSLADITVTVPSGEPRTIWLDTRDRILPDDRSLYIAIAAAAPDFGADDLAGTRITMVFTAREAAAREHVRDRLTQVIDNYGNIVECHPNQKKLRLFERYRLDLGDILRIDPGNEIARTYWSLDNSEQGVSSFKQPVPPPGAPLWAFRQVENMRQVEHFLRWWIEERQIDNGEFGGGLSDDGDMTNQWPGPALMGIEPAMITRSVLDLMEAFYEVGLFTDGLSTIKTDELHSYEEGINVLPQCMLLDYGDPRTVERLMLTARAYERITGINDRGQRQIRTAFFSGSSISDDSVWGTARTPYSYLVLHPGMSLVEFNGNPATRRILLGLADGLLEHIEYGANGAPVLPIRIWWPSGTGEGRTSPGILNHLLWACWRWTGDDRYLEPLLATGHRITGSLNVGVLDRIGRKDDWGAAITAQVTPASGSDLYRHLAWQTTGETAYLDGLYADQIERHVRRMPLYTEHHWWTDRVHSYSAELQRARLGGVALVRSAIYPGHAVSWNFHAPFRGDSVAILVSEARGDRVKIIAYNMENDAVTADLTGWDIDPGDWDVVQGVDTDDDGVADSDIAKRRLPWERTASMNVTFPPRRTTVITLDLKRKGTPYWKRPDLGIGHYDVAVDGNRVGITVHSLGSVDAPAGRIELVSPDGLVLAKAAVPELDAASGYEPVTAVVTLDIPNGTHTFGCTVRVITAGRIPEITLLNNTVTME
jgi:hypothetical protein